MPGKNVFPLTVRLAGLKLRRSRFTMAAAAGLPVLLVYLGLRDSPATAMKFFLLFFPYMFLLAAQDLAGTELRGGGLENVLFLGGDFRRYLWLKNPALAAAAGAYAAGLFLPLAAWTAARGTFEAFFLAQFGLGLLAGLYYLALAGALSYFLKAGSNVVVMLLVQAAAVVSLLLSAASRAGFIDHLGDGRFPDLGSRLLLFGFASLFPNLIVSRRLLLGALAVGAGLAAALAIQKTLARRLELHK
jgi:hypothetical protein